MGLEQTFAKGKYIGLYIGGLAAAGAQATEPADVVITATIIAVNATSGDFTAPTDALIKENVILEFSDGSTDVEVLFTADVTITSSATTCSIDDPAGDVGDGIAGALTASHTSTWDRLYRYLGTEQSDYSATPNAQTLQPTSYDAAYGRLQGTESEALSMSRQIDRQGRLKARDHAYTLIQTAVESDREIWLKQIVPDEENNPAYAREGRAKIRNYRESTPAGGIVDLGHILEFQGDITTTSIAAP